MSVPVRDAQGTAAQCARPFPPADLPAFTTIGARVMHSTEGCSQYRRGLLNNADRFGSGPLPIEWGTAGDARERGKGVCSACWENGRPIG